TEHLSMVFHRFLTEDGLVIAVDEVRIEPWDPFLTRVPTHVALLPSERLALGAGEVLVQPFVLPHFSRLTAAQHNAASGPRGWNHQQGFYVYRGRRLLVAGDWLGLGMQQEEHYKLARIRIDLDNAMDQAWQIDVRKSTARIPRQLTQELRRIADATRRRAAQAYRYRGKRLAGVRGAEAAFVWGVHLRDGSISYRIDRKHPVVRAALQSTEDAAAAVERLLRMVEETVPIGSIVMDARERPDATHGPFDGRETEVRLMLRETFEAMINHGGAPADALAMLATREPFSDFPELVAALQEDIG
ncbi:MAG: ATP-binding protein, partial [Candidatus Limnocylindria bacterium]